MGLLHNDRLCNDSYNLGIWEIWLMTRTPTKEDIEDLKLSEQMRDLIATPSWKVYEKILQTHIDMKTRELLLPLHPVVNQMTGEVVVADGISHVLVGEAAKGAILGLRLALTLPSGIVAGAEEIRRKLNPSDAEVTT